MLDVINLDFDYQDRPLLKQVNFHLPAGGLLHLQGANGVGKTTLLQLIAGLIDVKQGDILFCKQSIATIRSAYHQQLCYVGHKPGINSSLTVREHCMYDLHCDPDSEILGEFIQLFQLEPQLDKLCGLLSAGQKRKVALLRLAVKPANLWLLDEPFIALDDKAVNLVMDKIVEHRARKGAVLLTSHQPLPANERACQEYCL